MQEEPEQKQAEEPQEPAAEAAPDEAPAEETPAEETPAEETPAEETPAEEAPAEEAPAEPAEKLSPRARRRQARATAVKEQRPQRSPDERARERAEGRAQKAVARRRWRQKRKARDSEKGGDSASRTAGARQDGAPRAPGVRKTQQGVVVSSKGDKTITVRIDRVGRHRVYGKVVRQSSTLHAHDERNEAGEGDVVRVVEARPLSRTKRWRLVEVLEKAR